MQRGIYYLAEATLSLLLMSSFLIMVQPQQENQAEKIRELYITQCLHDVLKARFIERNTSITEMETDFRHLFPGKRGFVEVNNARIAIGKPGKQAVSASAVYYSLYGKSRLRVLVYID